MAIQHEDITDPAIHEPKGASTASADTVYVADGVGSGAWQKVDLDVMATAALYADIQTDLDSGALEVTGRFFLTGVIDDVSTTNDFVIFPIPRDCTVIGGRVTLGGAITVADASISFLNSSGASMGSAAIVPYSGSAKGTSVTFTASGSNTLVGPTWMEVRTDGGSTDAQKLFVTVELEYTVND